MSNWRDEYPFESNYLPVEGVGSTHRLHYIDTGFPSGTNPRGTDLQLGHSPTEEPQTILCVHGNPTWSFYYRSIIKRFQAGTRVVALDHLGCGLSDKPADYDYCLESHTKNLIQLIDELKLKNILMVVHDWGGAIGLGAAVARPECVDKLVILNTAAFVPPYIPLRISVCRFPILGSLAIRYANAFAGTATWMAIDRLKKLPDAAKSGLLYPYRSAVDRIAIDRFVQDIPMHKTHRTWDVLDRLENRLATLSNKPTTMVWGMKDWCFRPECLERLLQHLPHANAIRLEDVGHYVMEEAPQEVGDAIESLLKTAP